jgi:anti-anti-sigma factor
MVIRLPQQLDAKCARKLARELKRNTVECAACVVLDLSRVQSADVKGIEGLLSCMEDVAKRDGVLQLSGLSPEAATLLELTRVDQLMKKFPGFSIEAPQFEVATESRVEEVPAESTVQLPVAA